MSDQVDFLSPFEFSFQGEGDKIDIGRVPDLGRLVGDWVVSHYGDVMLFGILAFDEDKSLIGLRVEAYGPFDPDDEDLGDLTETPGGWDSVSNWLRSVGAEHLFTFVHRSSNYGHGVEPGVWDEAMSDATRACAREEGMHFQGHLITTGGEHMMLAPGYRHDHHEHVGLPGLLAKLDGPTKAAIGQQALDAMLAADPNTDPAIVAALKYAIEAHRSGNAVPDEGVHIVADAIQKLQANLDAGKGFQVVAEISLPPKKADKPQDNARPSVPRAFMN